MLGSGKGVLGAVGISQNEGGAGTFPDNFQDWGVFGVKHVTVKKRAHLVDQVGNPVKRAWCYSFVFKESEK